MIGGALLGAVAPIEPPTVDWLAIGPELALVGAGVAIVLARALLRGRPQTMPVCLVLAFSGLAAAGAVQFRLWNVVRDDGPISTVGDMVRIDLFGVFLGVVVIASTALAVLLSVAYLRREELEAPEYLSLVMLAGAGMLAMTTANDLIVVFVSLEVLSIPLYVLTAFDRRRLSSQEAGMKYFVLGAFSSALFLYGVALTYGATGTTSLTGIAEYLSQNTLFEQGTLARRLRTAPRGSGLQGRGGAVPHVDARRVPGCTDADHGVHGRGDEGRRVRRAAAGVRRRLPLVLVRLATGRRECSRACRSSWAASPRSCRPT